MAAMVMRGIQMKNFLLLPVVLAVGLGGCASNGVQPGIVNSQSSNGGGYQSASSPVSMGTGRVVAINEVQLAGSGGGGGQGMSNGTVSGGLIGGAGGAALGAVVGRGSLGGILIGGLLGAVGGGIAGTVYDGHRSGGGGRGIEVTVQREDGATMKVAQRDDGDVQLGDRVEIVQDSRGVSKVVHDNSRRPDDQQSPSAQNNGSQYNGPQSNGSQYNGPQSNGPSPDTQGSNQQYVPRDQDSPPSQGGQSYSQSRSTQRPQDDPRYGNLD
jgi:outer membrane lipoprotein SlyB